MLKRYLCGHNANIPSNSRTWFSALPTDEPIRQSGKYLNFSADTDCLYYRDDDYDFEIALLGRPYKIASNVEDRKPFNLRQFARELHDNGPNAIAEIGGPFALAFLNPRENELILAIDRFAIENIYYVSDGDAIAFSSIGKLLSSHPQVANRFPRQNIFDYLYFHCIPGPCAGYLNIERLLPGTYLRSTRGAIEVSPYWRPLFRSPSNGKDTPSTAELKTALSNAIKRRLNEDNNACFLSGGLDSSTVTGLCAELGDSVTTAFTIGFDADGYDETEFAKNVANHFGVEHKTYRVTPEDIVDSLPTLLSEFDAPFGNASAVPTYFCAKIAAESGFQRIMAGDGGDELFGGNTRYAKQVLFEAYGQIPRVIRELLVEPVCFTSNRIVENRFTTKVANYVKQANIPLPDRTQSYNMLARILPKEFLNPELIAGIDTARPLRILNGIYCAEHAPANYIDRLLRLDWRLTLADSDLPKVTRMANFAGIQVDFPMLDERVFDFSLALPAGQKVTRRELRPFFRRTFAPMLPRATLDKSKQGFGLPFGVWLQTHPGLRDLAQSSMEYLEQEKILRSGFHVKFMENKLHEHPGYYGTLLWLLLALSLWLQQQKATIV